MSKYGLEDEQEFESKEWVTLEPGTYELALVKVEPMEFKNTNPAYGEIGAIQKRLKWVFDDPETGATATMLTPTSRKGTKAKLPPVLKAFNGGRDLDPDVLVSAEAVEAFIDSRVGESVLCVVDTKEGSEGKVYNRVTAIMPLPRRGGGGAPRRSPAPVQPAPKAAESSEREIPEWL